MPDIKTLNEIGKFLTVYGGWGVSIFLGIFIMFLFRYFGKKLKEKDQVIGKIDAWWREERIKIANTFEEHRKENLQLVEKFSKSMSSVGSKMILCRDESRDTCLVLQRLLDAITGGVVKFKKPSQAEIESLTTFFNEEEK